MSDASRPLIRPAAEADLPAITAIYNDTGVATTASYDLEPATTAERRAWWQDHLRHGFPVLVAQRDGEVIGFAAYGTFRDKPGYRHTVEHSVYVADGERSSGVGRLLVSALVDQARGEGMHVMVGCLDAANQASLAFHERLGFREVGRMPEVGRKFDRWLDAVFVQLVL